MDVQAGVIQVLRDLPAENVVRGEIPEDYILVEWNSDRILTHPVLVVHEVAGGCVSRECRAGKFREVQKPFREIAWRRQCKIHFVGL